MITVKYLTFKEIEAKLEESGNKFDFESLLKSNYTYMYSPTHQERINPIYQSGTIIDDVFVKGENGYLVNHDFGDSQNSNPLDEDGEISSAACLSLKAEIENWLIGRAAYYADKVAANELAKYDTVVTSTNNTGWDYNKTEDNGTNGNTQKYLDTPETEADYTGDTHITNLTKNDGTSSNTRTSDGKNGLTGTVTTSGDSNSK